MIVEQNLQHVQLENKISKEEQNLSLRGIELKFLKHQNELDEERSL